jgi:hypothetical protein
LEQNVNIELPADQETERLLLGALLLMLPADRDAAVAKISTAWFLDPWNQRFFNVLTANRRRDFGPEIMDYMRSTDGPTGKTAWWIAMLLCDRDGEPNGGRPQLWRDYARTLERVYAARVKMLILLEQLNEVQNGWRLESCAICQPAKRNAETDDRPAGTRPGAVLDRDQAR